MKHILFAFMGFFLFGCSGSDTPKSRLFTQETHPQVSEQALYQVNASFSQRFILGDWRYTGSKVIRGEINAFIKIPQAMDMNKADQENYLKYAICPTAEDSMWQGIGDAPLYVHVYVSSKRHSVYSLCPAPQTVKQV